MRTIIDITEEQVKALDEISQLEDTSRAALIRRAIDRMLAEDARRDEVAKEAFGIWSYREESHQQNESPESRVQSSVEEAKSSVVSREMEEITQPNHESRATSHEPRSPIPQTATDPLAAFFAGVKP